MSSLTDAASYVDFQFALGYTVLSMYVYWWAVWIQHSAPEKLLKCIAAEFYCLDLLYVQRTSDLFQQNLI